MSNDLDSLLAEGVITEVVARLKSGKEADVFVVRYQGRDVAAKVYKDRKERSFKNNAAYKEGRSVRNTRSQRAIEKGSKFGREAEEDAWKSAEVDAIYRLHAAGVRVPAPVLYFDGVLLMELVLDAEGAAARRVIDVPISVQDARDAYEDLLRQLVRILSCDLIHGDLSPYNVLWSANGPTIIDFPQIISASHNQASEQFFLRDARNILGYLATIVRSLNARSGDPFEIWRAYRRRELTPDFVPRSRPMAMQRPLPLPGAGGQGDAHQHGPPRGPRHGQHGVMQGGQTARDGQHGPAPNGQHGFARSGPAGGHHDGGDRRGPPRQDRGPRPDPRPAGPHAQQGRPDFGPRGRGGPPDRPMDGQGRADRPRADDRQRTFGSKRPAPAPEVIVRRAPSAIGRDEPPARAHLPDERRQTEVAPSQPAPRRRRFPG